MSNGVKELSGTHQVRVSLPAMTGATADDEFVVEVAGTNAVIKAVRFIPGAAVTANVTNFTILSVRNRKADASGTALPASRTWAATNSVAQVADVCTLSATASDLLVSAGDVLTVQRLHTAAGLVIPAGVVEIDYQIR